MLPAARGRAVRRAAARRAVAAAAARAEPAPAAPRERLRRLSAPRDYHPQLAPLDAAAAAELARGYGGAVAHLDAQIGRVLDALDDGAARDAVVLVTSDHGFALGDHGALGKRGLSDAHGRVPLIVRDPSAAARDRGGGARARAAARARSPSSSTSSRRSSRSRCPGSRRRSSARASRRSTASR